MYRRFVISVIFWWVLGLMAVLHIAVLIEQKVHHQHLHQQVHQHLHQEQHPEQHQQPHQQQQQLWKPPALEAPVLTLITTPVLSEPTTTVKIVDGVYSSYFAAEVLPAPRGLHEPHLSTWKSKGISNWKGVHGEVWSGANFMLPIPIANCGMSSVREEFMASGEPTADVVRLQRVAVALAPEAWSWQHFIQDVMPKIVFASEAVGGLAGLADREFLLPPARDSIVYEIMDFLRLRYTDEPRPPVSSAFVVDGLVACKVPGNLLHKTYSKVLYVVMGNFFVDSVRQERTPGSGSACTGGYILQIPARRDARFLSADGMRGMDVRIPTKTSYTPPCRAAVPTFPYSLAGRWHRFRQPLRLPLLSLGLTEVGCTISFSRLWILA